MKSSDASRHYDRLDVWYRALWGEHLHHGLWEQETESREEASLNLLHAIASAARLVPGLRICDVGCGYGGPARWLAARMGGEVTAVTNSEKQFAFLEGVATTAVVPVLADWMENGLADGSFERVLAIESIAHFPDPGMAIGEMWRVLKPGGFLVITTWVENDDLPWWARWFLLDPIRKTGAMPGLSTEGALCNELPEWPERRVSVSRVGAKVARTWSSGMKAALLGLIQSRELRREALRHPLQAWRLALSSLQIWFGYRLEMLDYVILTVEKTGSSEG